MSKVSLNSLIIGLIGLISIGCVSNGRSTKFQEYIETTPGANKSQAMMMMHDFGGLSASTLQTNAYPYKMAIVALLEANNLPMKPESIKVALQKYGFLFPKSAAYWDNQEPFPSFTDSPVGITTGILKVKKIGLKVDVANGNCALCHSSVEYDATGNPNLNKVFVGGSNSSIDLDHYTGDMLVGMKKVLTFSYGKHHFLRNVERVFPEISKDELKSLGRIFYDFGDIVRNLDKQYGALSPFSNGGPGAANGIASFKRILKVNDFKKFDHTETSINNIPDLSDRYMKSLFLSDGLYTSKKEDTGINTINLRPTTYEDLVQKMEKVGDIATVFLTPALGEKIDESMSNAHYAKEIIPYLASYHAQRFPGKLDLEKVKRGKIAFDQKCSKCHGTFSESLLSPVLMSYPNRLIPLDVIGTDSERAHIKNRDKVISYGRKTKFAELLNLNEKLGYVPPVLTGVWNTAPYFHNGSVPTLWALMNPELRPKKFYVGGHKLDFENVGIEGDMQGDVMVYKQDYKPWSSPYLFDTTTVGRSNKGHEFVFNKIEQETKKDIIEYLKTL